MSMVRQWSNEAESLREVYQFQNTNMDSALPFSFWRMGTDRWREMWVYKAFCKANGTLGTLTWLYLARHRYPV